jgi:TRAP-type C4-dicarboxylate transport system substrate-binding protein
MGIGYTKSSVMATDNQHSPEGDAFTKLAKAVFTEDGGLIVIAVEPYGKTVML